MLHVFSSAGLYGAEHVVLGLIPALAELGIKSTLACIDNPYLSEQPLYDRARELEIPAQRIPCRGRLDSATTGALAGLLRRHTSPVLHVHGYKGTFYALRARRSQPCVPIVSTLHGWITNTRALWFYRMLELWMLRRMQRVCTVSQAMHRPLLAAGIAPERIRLVENGIDTTRFRPDTPPLSRADLDFPEDTFVFGAVQRLGAEKNPLGLLEAFIRTAAQEPRARLVVAGDGPQRTEFECRARAAGVTDRIRLLGARSDPERIYPLFDCFVLPSLTEGLPLALLEAMACERPVVATRVGQVAAALDELPAGLVAPGDVDALFHAMRATMHHPPPGGKLRQRVLARYSVSRMAHDYSVLYRELGGCDVDQAA